MLQQARPGNFAWRIEGRSTQKKDARWAEGSADDRKQRDTQRTHSSDCGDFFVGDGVDVGIETFSACTAEQCSVQNSASSVQRVKRPEVAAASAARGEADGRPGELGTLG